MDHSEIEKILKKMVDLFGKIPDPMHQPKQFEHLVKMYFYIMESKN